ncbi:hypothetical protein F0562_010608 [Nyssa sinensis]|uniref:Glutamate receptor n=1 Tax=Nyssa sinensis TaxID=561372 RepID=A0A5J5A3H5_9ASTE|nr:hypothetical protein F0562_010608 [Nyssa sinensis]
MVLALSSFSKKPTVHGGMNTTRINHVKRIVGAIVDYSSRIGKEEKVAMEMAIDDFFNYTNQSLILQLKYSQGEPIKAALAATDLINTQRVQAIVGPRTWEEASLVAEVGSQSNVPVLSLADPTPPWATKRWPFLIQASPSQQAQMKAVAAIVQSWGWRRVILIYEDTDSAAIGVIPHLSDALQEVGAEISHFVAIPPLASSSLSEELEKLKRQQCRVFVVHSSLPLALPLFETAKKMKMMEKDYVWITTDSTASLVRSIINKATAISSMQGVLGVMSYFPETGPQFQDFHTRFRRKFSAEHPEEDNYEPGIFALQAYDATRAVALAMVETNESGQQLFDKILLTDFNGLSGKIQFTEQKLAPGTVFLIINVIGKSYRELGFWSDGGLGFSESIDEGAIYNASMENLSQVFWPGGPRTSPRGWTLSTISGRLRVGVPNDSYYSRFVKVEYDYSTNNYSVTGFSIDVFRETVKLLPYYLPYDFIPFNNGTYDALVQQIQLKKFDAVVGASMIAGRCKYADFAHPHTQSVLVMVVPVQSQSSNKAWLFMKPFTKAMWTLTACINVFNGFVVWLIERNHCSELRGSALNQLGTLLWLAFVTLFSLRGEKLHSNLSRMATVTIETLKNSNAMIGYTNKSFIVNYLVDVLHFNAKHIKIVTTPEGCAQALRNGEIAAVFLEVLVAKLFLATYCNSFIIAGPTYKIGGSAFAFPKGSPMVSDINEALLKVIENGKLLELENNLTASDKCVDVESDHENISLSPSSFLVLFIFQESLQQLL